MSNTPLKDGVLTGAAVVKPSASLTIQGSLVMDTGSTLSLLDNSVGWGKVSKSGSSIADLATRNASDVVNTPSGGIVATNVQAALNELDSEISAGGQTLIAYVTNAEATSITRGQVVYLFGASGDRATVKLASNSSESTSSKTFGVVKDASIAANGQGYVICQGVLEGVNLGAFTAGQTVYLGATAGSFTATKPSAPAHLVYVGIVQRANSGNGMLYVKVQNGYELDEIHDVAISSPTTGQTLVYNAVTGLWNNSNTLTLSGSTINSSAIGASNPSTGAFTTLNASSLTLSSTNSSALTDLLINPTTKASGNLIDAQVGGVSKFKVTSAGVGTFTGDVTIANTSNTVGILYLNGTTGAGQIWVNNSQIMRFYDTSYGTQPLYLETNGGLRISSTTASTSTSTGALVVSGGVGIAKSIYIGANSYLLTSDTNQIIAGQDGSGWYYGGAGGGNSLRTVYIGESNGTQKVLINPTTASLSTTTGALVVSGGVGIGGSVHIGGSDLKLTAAGGNLTLGEINTTKNIYFSTTATDARISSNGYSISLIARANQQILTYADTTLLSQMSGVSGALTIGLANGSNTYSTQGAWFTNQQANNCTYTDTTSSGTVALRNMVSFNQQILAASSATTYTDASNLYLEEGPSVGTNVTITNRWSLYSAGKVKIANTTDTTGAGTGALQVSGGAYVAKAIIGASTIKTAAPTSGTASAWKLGEAATVSPTSPNRTIRVEIEGTVYYIHAKTTND